MTTYVQRLHGRFYLIPLLLLVVDAVLSLYESLNGQMVRGRFSILAFGVTAAWVSFFTGIIALISIRKNEVAAGLFFIHGFINSIPLLVLSAFWSNDWKNYPGVVATKLPVAFIKWLMVAMLLTGIYLGKKAARKLANR